MFGSHKTPQGLHHAGRWVTMLALGAGLMACSSTTGEGAAPGAVAPAQASALPQAPLKIPMPLDKAGHKVDVTFEVPPLPKGERYRSYFVGLRMLFTPGIGDTRIDVIDQNPVAARLLMHRIEGGKEVPVPLGIRKNVAKPNDFPEYKTFLIADNTASVARYYSDYSGAPPGTPDASTYVMIFAAPQVDSSGVYRLRLETLLDIPQLKGVKGFFVYEEVPKR